MANRIGEGQPKVEKANWNVLIATPAYDGKVDCDYSQSLAEASFCAPLFQVKITASVMGNGAFIDLVRNLYVKMFLEEHKECTHLFFIDSDLKFSPNAFIGLIRSGLPICAGVYRRRQAEEDYPMTFALHPETGGMWLEEGFILAERVPTGFLCIRRDVLEEMAKDAVQLNIEGQKGPVPRLFYTKIDKDGRYVGEDFCFCDDYIKKYNKPIHVWPDIDFVHGGYKGNLQDFLENKIKEAKEKDEMMIIPHKDKVTIDNETSKDTSAA